MSLYKLEVKSLLNAEENARLWDILACPRCLSSLSKINTGIECTSCHTRFKETESGQLDFRLKKEKIVKVPFSISPSYTPNEDLFHLLPMNPKIEAKTAEPQLLSKELTSYIPHPFSNSSMMLDLGCGNSRHRSTFEQAGYKYVGLDIASQEATILGDAHALPFKDESFEFLFSFAVLEHLQFPFVAMNEAYRILKHGTRFIGSVAFLEPFHGNSFYHHTHYGLLSCLEHAGFKVEHISPNPSWDVLTAQASMSLFPKMPKTLSRALVLPLKTIHKMYWKTAQMLNPNQANEIKRLLWTTGAFLFIASKQ
jgi:SAM-dependent methyltransferase